MNKFLILIIKILMFVHSKSYELIGRFSIKLNKGIHPKHNIIKYKEWFLEKINLKDIILDIGCNRGQIADLLATKASFVYGIDINNNHISYAIRNNLKTNIEYICSDATSYDYALLKKKINTIILSNVLEHIEQRITFLKKLINQINNRKLKILIRVPTIEREWLAFYKKLLGSEYRLDKTHYIEYTEYEFKKEIQEAGLKIVSFEKKFGEFFVECKND